MADFQYQRIIRAVQSSLWAILPARLQDIMDVLQFQAGGGKLSAEELNEFLEIEAAAKKPQVMMPESGKGVAVLGLRGIISHRIEQVQAISGPGGTSIEGFRQRFRDALASSQVGSIVIDVDSPGGAVDGVPEMAAEIAASRGDKPIVAVANTLAASAAYWLASQADEVVVTPSGEVGSIGVFTAHRDQSEAMAAKGERVTLIHAGKHKVEGNPFEPLPEEARLAIQERVDDVYAEFVDAVASGRGVALKKVLNGFGEGRTVGATPALAEGMVDRVETLEETINRLRGGASQPQRRAGAQRISPNAFEFLSSGAS